MAAGGTSGLGVICIAITASVAAPKIAAAIIAALLIFSALENGDRAGLLLFTDRIERYVPPRKGKKHGLRLITEALLPDDLAAA